MHAYAHLHLHLHLHLRVQQQICLTIAHVIYGDFGIRFQNEVKEAGLHSIYLVKPQLNSVSTLSFFA